jgi:hypothetical protein
LRTDLREKYALQKEQRSFATCPERSRRWRIMLLLFENLRPPQHESQQRRSCDASLDDEPAEGLLFLVASAGEGVDGVVDWAVDGAMDSTASVSNSSFF